MKGMMIIKNNILIYIQDTLHKNKILRLKDCQKWIKSVSKKNAKITIRLVDDKESQDLNKKYRKKNEPTNILSFLISKNPIIGDLVLCHPVIKNEAKLQKKKIQEHYAHLIIHGYLHLKGYGHENKEDTLRMENKEIKILKSLGVTDPYLLK
jgi:probable rRNA maturation factor